MLDLTPVYDDEPLSVSQLVVIPRFNRRRQLSSRVWALSSKLALHHDLLIVNYDEDFSAPPNYRHQIYLEFDEPNALSYEAIKSLKRETGAWRFGDITLRVIDVRARYEKMSCIAILTIGKQC